MTNALAYTRSTSCHTGQHNKYRHTAMYNNWVLIVTIKLQEIFRRN